MHLLLKIVLHPTRSWNESWLPVLQSYPKSRSPCHLWTRGLKYHNSTRPPRHLAPIAAKVAHQGLPSDACSLLGWPTIRIYMVLFLGCRHSGIGAQGVSNKQKRIQHCEPTADILDGKWILGGGAGVGKKLFSFLLWAS